jgi:hypothetical protein
MDIQSIESLARLACHRKVKADENIYIKRGRLEAGQS